MKCNLTSLIDALKLEFPLETCGDMALQISDLQGLTPDNPPTRPDVLYTIEQNQLLRYQGTPAKGPVLCIGHTGWTLRHSQSSFPALILVLCPEPSRVYAALSRILFQEGARSSQMPEVSAAFLRCRSMDALIERGYAYLGNPFAIHNSDGKLLAYSRQAGLRDAAWKSEAFLSTLSQFHSVENATAMEHARRDQVPVLLTSENGPQQLRMVLGSRGQTLGYLTVVAQFRPFSGADSQIAELLGCFITLDLLRQNSITRVSVSDAGHLKSFLEAGEVNLPEVPQWLEQQNCTCDQRYYLLLFNGSSSSKTPFFDVDSVLSLLDRLFPNDICTRLEAGVVLLLQCTGTIRHSAALDELFTSLSPAVNAGISNPFRSLAEAGHGALRQARSALELGSVLHPEHRCYYYEDYAVYTALRAAANHIDLRELLPTGLQELLDSDTTGESLHTLEIYLSTGGKKARAAELLYIHLNTLKYRISTLSAKLDADLDDPATMFSLSHALHIVRYLRCFGENA